MSQAQQTYFDCIKRTLHAAICLCSFPSPTIERHNKPEVEMQTTPELLGNPILICRDEQERCLIEPSVNSVRVSLCFKMPDAAARMIGEKYVGFLEKRAGAFHILRRKPIDSFDVSFLITNDEAETMHKHKVIDFIIQFVSDVEKDITEMKSTINGRAHKTSVEWFSACP
jgi:actin related protein 2/3 complex subunit 4